MWLFNIASILKNIDSRLKEIQQSLKRLETPPKPWKIKLYLKENRSTNMLKFKLVLPVPGASDVVKRNLSVKVGENEGNVLELAGDAVEVDGFAGNDNDNVHVVLSDVDDNGNVSPERVQDFVLVDTFAPPVPGEIGILVTGEE